MLAEHKPSHNLNTADYGHGVGTVPQKHNGIQVLRGHDGRVPGSITQCFWETPSETPLVIITHCNTCATGLDETALPLLTDLLLISSGQEPERKMEKDFAVHTQAYQKIEATKPEELAQLLNDIQPRPFDRPFLYYSDHEVVLTMMLLRPGYSTPMLSSSRRRGSNSK